MGLHKGQTNNPDGRPKGSQNKISGEVKMVLKSIVDQELEKLPERLNTLDDKERIEVLTKLLPYVLPKQHKVETDGYKKIVVTRKKIDE